MATRALYQLWRHRGTGQAKADGVSFLSIDPGDMDTPLHALAVPDADPSTLKRPDEAAAEVGEQLFAALPGADAWPIAARR